MNRRWRAARRGVAGLALLLLLAGCVRIPLEGEVSTATIDTEAGGDELLVLPESPAAGATPREILLGFILAGRGPQNGYAVAAEYLTDDFAASWWPGAGVIVTPSAINPVEHEDGTMSITVDVSAELDARGRYTAAPAATQRELVYEFVQENGEWRISAGPDGTVLSSSSFEAIFEPARLYYFSPDFRFLVPELRWFLDTRTIANRIVEQLLAADAPLLASGVLRTAFPAGTDLLDTVGIDGGSANVTLSSQVLAADEITQSRMHAQLDWSIGSLGDVSSVTVIAGGFPVAIPSPSGIDPLQVDPLPIGVIDGVFGSVGAQGVTPIVGLGSAIDGLGASAVALGRDRMSAAVLTDEGALLVTAQGSELRDARPGLAAPSLDPWGWLWSAPRDDPSGLVATAAGGGQVELPVELDGRIVSLQLARDGTRLLVAVDTGGGARVVVWGVARDEDMSPTALVDPVLVADGGELADATWVDGTTIATLGRGASPSVTVHPLGGRGSSLGSAAGGVQLVGGNNSLDGIRVRTESGSVLRPGSEMGWLDTGWAVSFLGVQM